LEFEDRGWRASVNTIIQPDLTEDIDIRQGGPWIVILYNDDYHSPDEVIMQVQKATGCSLEKAVAIMLEAHTTGRAIAYTGTEEECERVAGVLRQIRLQVETDRA
jgi:ATP-dependent Clp protease adaptor protein ClpS